MQRWRYGVWLVSWCAGSVPEIDTECRHNGRYVTSQYLNIVRNCQYNRMQSAFCAMDKRDNCVDCEVMIRGAGQLKNRRGTEDTKDVVVPYFSLYPFVSPCVFPNHSEKY